MATKDEQETLRLLVQYVSRSFYESKFIIIMDQLARHPVLKDDDLAGRVGLHAKELNKIMAVLTNDHLVTVYRQNELKEGAARSVGKQYYYIDFTMFCNVVKWRVAEMRRMIDSTLRNELDNKGYICPQCGKTFSPLEVDKLMDFSRGIFACDICSAELEDNENAESVRGSQDRMQRFNRQMTFIREGLRKSEDMVIPAFDPASWIRINLTGSDKQQMSADGSGIKIAGTGEKRVDEGIGVLISMDKDEATRKAEREREAEAKRQQNAMPSWHQVSTVSGHKTSLGFQAEAHAAASGSTSNNAILNGLGAAPMNGFGGIKGVPTIQTKLEEEESVDVKPDLEKLAEKTLYDQYYASLERAHSSAPTANGTPAIADSNSWPSDSDDEDKKPGAYLDTPNEFGKRSRSREASEGVKSEGRSKIPRTDSADTEDTLVDVPAPSKEGATYVEGFPMDTEPTVYMNGKPMKLSQVTEEEAQEQMTPAEYEVYVSLLLAG